MLGVSKPTISKYESGKAIPSAETLEKVASIGNVSKEWLLRGEGGQPGLQDFVPESYEIGRSEPIEPFLLYFVLEEVENFLREKRLKPSLEKKARLLTKVYNHCNREFDKPGRLIVEKYWNLI